MISGMSWIDNDNTTSTEVVNREHKKFHLSSKLEYCTNKSYDNYSTNDNIRFMVLKFSTVQLSWINDYCPTLQPICQNVIHLQLLLFTVQSSQSAIIFSAHLDSNLPRLCFYCVYE